jgi:isocitrate/isopropylmalate dehydrogenase
MPLKQVKIITLNGDGVGPEVVAQAVKSLKALNDVSSKSGVLLEFQSELIGGCAIDKTGSALPDKTLDACRTADAILLGISCASYHDFKNLGAVGGPQWPKPATAEIPHPERPEQVWVKVGI